MKTIGILDDRNGEFVTSKTIIDRALKDASWRVIKVPLLGTPAQVVEWLAHEDVSVLVADQVLSDNPHGEAVNYQGTDVVNEVRHHLPDLPVYMITAFPNNPDVAPNLPRMEGMVRRGQLGKDAAVIVPRMKRAGETFERRHRAALSRLTQLSQKSASGKLTAAEQAELQSLQLSLSLADTSSSREQLLPDLEASVQQLAALQIKAAKLVMKQVRKS